MRKITGIFVFGALVTAILIAPMTLTAQTASDSQNVSAPPSDPAAQKNLPPKRKATAPFKSKEILVELKGDDGRVLSSPASDPALTAVYGEFGKPKVEPLFRKPPRTLSWDDHVKNVKQRFPARAKRSRHQPRYKPGRFYKLSFAVTDAKLSRIIEDLRSSPAIRSVSHNAILHADVVPNDSYWGTTGTWGESYQDLWGLYMISAGRAWISGATGGSGVIVGIVDTGLDLTHADISDNLYANTGETAGNGADDDGNGYVDDTAGWDFVNDDGDPTDDHYHGTHVAGTIAATGNNATGIVGVMWDAQILPVKALDSNGDGDMADIANAIMYAADRGSDVINLSLGGDDNSTLEAAVEYAYNLGVVVVAAAGNDTEDAMDHAPAMYDEAITVASSSPDDELSSFSNFGPKIDVTAPGEDILSLLASGGTISSSSADIVGTNYYRESGTSMAAPHVSGAAGLLLAAYPTLTNEEVRQALRKTNDISAAGWDEETGHGRLNVYKGLSATSRCEALITDPDNNGDVLSNLTLTGSAGGTDFNRYRISLYEGSTRVTGTSLSSTAVSDGTLGTLTIPGFTPGGDYSVRLNVYDSSGAICGRDRREVSGSYTVGTYDTPGYARDVVISGSYAYVADWGSGLEIYDISTPSSPTLVGSYTTSAATALALSYSVTFGVSGGSAFPISPLKPSLTAQYAYVADVGSGLRIIDVSTPSSPTLVGTLDTSGAADGVAVSGNYAYVADRTSGLQIIDVSTPSSPTLVGSYDTSGEAKAVALSGNYAYVADYDGGILVIDVSTPSVPTLAGSYAIDGYAVNVFLDGDTLYVADYWGFTMLDVSTPSNPTLITSLETDGTSKEVVVDGDYAYVADYSSGLRVVDLSIPTVPFLAATYDTEDKAYAVDVEGGYAVVADNESGIQVLSLTAPLADDVAVTAGEYDTSGFAYALAVSGNYAYVADGSSGLQIIDISTPSSPALEGTYDTSGNAYGVAVSGYYAYVADQSSGLQIIDVSAPSSPTLTGTYNTPGSAKDVTVDGTYAYVADYSGGLQIIDVSAPASPTLTGSYTDSTTAYSVAVDGAYAYLADGEAGLAILDVSDPSSPTLVGSYDTDGEARAVALSGNTAFVADNTSGLQVIDVSTPSSPTLVGNYPTESNTLGVMIVGSYAYVADGYSGLQVLDISTPSSPSYVTGYNTSAFAFETATDGTYFYMADWSTGLQVVYVRVR